MSQTQEFDTAVIGGGLVGSAIGYGLARRGERVVQFDEGDIAWRAARGNFGLVWVQGKGLGLPAYGGWTQLSARRWPEFAALLRDETGVDVALEQPGGLHLCLSERELEHRITVMNRLVNQPGFERYPFEVLDHAGVQRLFPGVGPDVVGGTYTALDGHVNPLKLLRALHAAFAARAGTYRANAKVDKVGQVGGRFVMDAAGGRFAATRVVLAAGLGNAGLAPQLGLQVPVRPQRGQLIALERVRRFMHCPMGTLRQTDEGTVLIGDSQEEAGFDTTTGSAVLATLADRARRIYPMLADVRVVRTWAALRVMSPDGFPVYEQSRVAPGAFVATCHSGVTLAAAHALELAPRIAAGDLGAPLAPFTSERFHVSKAA
jgi:glycine/D-amino acid oxidase-like deaminating enzyme